MKNLSEENFEFYPVVEGLESILGYASNPMELTRLINENEFIQLRNQIIDLFDISIENHFTGKFGEEVEFGDVSDAVRETTFALYPQSTDIQKYIDPDERKIWCEKILETMDAAALYY